MLLESKAQRYSKCFKLLPSEILASPTHRADLGKQSQQNDISLQPVVRSGMIRAGESNGHYKHSLQGS